MSTRALCFMKEILKAIDSKSQEEAIMNDTKKLDDPKLCGYCVNTINALELYNKDEVLLGKKMGDLKEVLLCKSMAAHKQRGHSHFFVFEHDYSIKMPIVKSTDTCTNFNINELLK